MDWETAEVDRLPYVYRCMRGMMGAGTRCIVFSRTFLFFLLLLLILRLVNLKLNKEQLFSFEI